MFFVYRVNKLDIFLNIVIEIIKNDLSCNFFQSEIFLIEDNKTEKWVKLMLSKYFGVFGNIKCYSANDFVWKLCSYIFSENVISHRSFSYTMLTWKIMKILSCLFEKKEHSIFSTYLCMNQDEYKCFQFSKKMALLFNKYMIFRPDWLVVWEKGELVDGISSIYQNWQALLWREVIKITKSLGDSVFHIANFYKKFTSVLGKKFKKSSKIPKRIFVFGIPSGLILSYLRDISYYIDIHLLFIDPCFCVEFEDFGREFFDFDNMCCDCFYFDHQKIQYSLLKYDFYTKRKLKNFFLFSWKKLREECLTLLFSTLRHFHKIDLLQELGDNTSILSIIKNDIFIDQNYSEEKFFKNNEKVKSDNVKKRILSRKDHSFNLHICYNIQKEIEVLYNTLLNMMLNDSKLRPEDILVMAPDINLYISEIEKIFNNVDSQYCIPYSISDQKIEYAHSIFFAFLKLLRLPNSECIAESVLELLELSCIADNFSIKLDDIDLIRHWVFESGIRWGINNDIYNELMLPVFNKNTWEFGLNRMLLGYSIDNIQCSWDDIYPYSQCRGEDLELIGCLSKFIFKLNYWRKYLFRKRMLEEWESFFFKITHDFFCFNSDVEKYFIVLKGYWNDILYSGLIVKYNKPISIELIYDELVNRLNDGKVYQKFLGGGINFCSLFSNFSFSFKVIYLIGINEIMYPKKSLLVNFDLMKGNVRCGDFFEKKSDRYFFLSLILGAEKFLYISCTENFYGVSYSYPSVIVNELFEYISYNFCLSGDENVDEKISIFHVKRHLCHIHMNVSYMIEKEFSYKEFKKEYKDVFIKKKNKEKKNRSVFFQDICVSNSLIIPFSSLQYFYSHPIRAWFKERLSIFYGNFFKFQKYESFFVDYLTRYKLNDYLLFSLLNGKNGNFIYEVANGIGMLPYNSFGKVYWEKQYANMLFLAKKIQKYKLTIPKTLEINLDIFNFKIIGFLPFVRENGLLRWKPKKLTLKDILLLWLEHLVYCASGGVGESRLFGVNKKWVFRSLSCNEAKELLVPFLLGYQRGIITPLFLVYDLAEVWLSSCFDRKSRKINWDKNIQNKSINSLILSWYGNSWNRGANKDLYLYKMIKNLNNEYIEVIISEAEQYLFPLLFFKK
ncbi:MAG: exodeoxyribonuclease V subunit RecC [Candidatus Westeberhardia cardiocondylae]|nr:exodeoxyribonuclease V subunit RecC [Candidatus Westeberhardia cardiocondylae]